MKKLIIFELITIAVVWLAYLGGIWFSFVPHVDTFSGTTIGIFALTNSILVSVRRQCVVAMSTIITTSIIAIIFAKTVTAVTIVGPIFVVAMIATVVASELRAKYWQVLLSLLAEGAIIIALFKYGCQALSR